MQLSDPTGQYEVTVFSDTLEAARAHFETGAQVVLTVEATMEADQLKLLARSAAPIDSLVAAGESAGLRIFSRRRMRWRRSPRFWTGRSRTGCAARAARSSSA